MSWYATATGNAGVRGPRVPKPKAVKLPPKPKLHLPTRPKLGPFDPLTDSQLQAQASGAVQAGLGPIIQQIKDAIAQRSQQGSAAITGYTSALAGLLSKAGPETAAAYQQAEGAQTSANNALADRLSSFGSHLASEQGSQLASINAPAATAAQTAQTAQTATGAANAGFAKGNAELGNLIAHGASQQGYNASLPGIAALTGAQNLRQFQAQLSQQLGTQLSAAQAQAAQQIAATFQHLKDLELNKAVDRVQLGLKTSDQKYSQSVQAAKLKLAKQIAAWNRATKQDDLKIKQQSANISQQNANTSAQNANTTATRASNTASHNRVTERQGATRNQIAQQNANTNRYRAHHRKSSGNSGGYVLIPPKRHHH